MPDTSAALPLTLAALIGAAALLSASPSAHAQPADALTLSGAVDVFYAWDADRPANDRRPPFFYNHARHNAFSLNLALIHLAWTPGPVRANLGLLAGTYPQDNLNAEEPLLQHVYEASLGVQTHADLWLDAGIFPSHIGAEYAISTLNPTLTRSIQAENSPYYLAGARLTWTPTPTLTAVALVANGWQNIRETPNNDAKGFGAQLTLTPAKALTLNWSGWVSDEAPSPADALRVFNDLYALIDLDPLRLTAVLDLGAQQHPQGGWSLWHGATLIARLQLPARLALAARLERYSDPDGTIVAFDGAGTTLHGASLGLDLDLTQGVLWRVEGRTLFAEDPVFGEGFDGARWNTSFTTSLAASF